MKGKILFVALIISAAQSFAQQDSTHYIAKGDWLVGGSLSYQSFANKSNPCFNLSASPGYMIGNRFAVGLDVNYFYVNGSTKGAWPYPIKTTDNYSLFSVNIFARVYISTKRFAPYAEFGFGGISSVHDGFRKLTYNQELYKGALGFNCFLSQSVAFNFALSYSYLPYFEPQRNYNNDRSSIGSNLGFQLYLSRNKKKKISEDDFLFPQKGTWMLGGAIDGRDAIEFLRGYERTIYSAEVARFLKHNVVVGLRLGHSNLAQIKSKSFNLFARYYATSKRLAPFGEFSICRIKSNSDYDTYEKKYGTRGGIQAGAGLNYFITNSFAIESKFSLCRDVAFDKAIKSFQTGLQFFLSRRK